MKLNQIEIESLKSFVFDNGTCPWWLEAFAAEQWADRIPYGTLTGDDSTIDEWLCDHLDLITDHFEKELENK